MEPPLTTTHTLTDQIIQRHDRYMSINYGRSPIAMVRGQGAKLWDANDNQYLDLFAGFGASLLGHCHPDLVTAVTDQARKLWHVGNLFHTEPQTRLAKYISEQGFGGRSFFCHAGADANEAAIKLARLYGSAKPTGTTPRYKIINAHKSFHGRSFATMAATGQDKVRQGFAPLPPGFSHVPYNDLSAIENAIDQETVAVMLEPIQGEGGVVVPDEDFFPKLRALCDKNDLLLIIDEVWTGGGRTGKTFAYQHWNFTPDIMTLAKGVGGGLPVGVMCAADHLAELYDVRKTGAVKHATTLGGNCLSMAVAAKVFQVIQRDNLTRRAAQLGQVIVDRLTTFAKDAPIQAIRGKGLFIGIELDPTAPGAWFDNASDIVDRCLERGILINATQGTVIRLAPPLIIETSELDQGLEVLQAVIRGD